MQIPHTYCITKVTLFLIALLLPFSSFCQDSLTTHYKIYNTQTQKPATVDDIIAQMQKADVLFFGQSTEFFQVVNQLAEEADAARREF